MAWSSTSSSPSGQLPMCFQSAWVCTPGTVSKRTSGHAAGRGGAGAPGAGRSNSCPRTRSRCAARGAGRCCAAPDRPAAGVRCGPAAPRERVPRGALRVPRGRSASSSLRTVRRLSLKWRASALTLQPCWCRTCSSIQSSSNSTVVPLGAGGLNTAQLARRDFLFSDHDQVQSTPRTCALFVLRTAHYSCSPTLQSFLTYPPCSIGISTREGVVHIGPRIPPSSSGRGVVGKGAFVRRRP